MKKSILSFLVLSLAPMAFASELPNPLLLRQFTSGFVRPQNFLQSSCYVYPKVHPIYSGVVAITERKGTDPAQKTRVKQIQWTAEVPNEAAVVTLTQNVGTEKVKLSVPADVPSIRHSAIETVGAGAPKFITLRFQNSDGDAEMNPSAQAKALVAFLDLNCQ